ncbi:MAG: hypothetical protein JNK67_29015 [Alphaproteobacteria bacterium]|nr:hypothetical protein [Alphaproteobacteria bacterium]
MARANRIAPTGERFATPERGLLMGNRGCLVDAAGAFTRRRWTTRAWICCRLDWKGRQLPVAPPGRWTALFFLDEATALAAGHRPCGFCRHAALVAFKAALGEGATPIATVDAALHAARLVRPYPRRALGALPEGAMLRRDGDPSAWLLWRGALRRWTPGGYRHADAPQPDPDAVVDVLTPAPMLAALAGGYRPIVHPSALPESPGDVSGA